MNLIGASFNWIIDSNKKYVKVIEDAVKEANFWKKKYQEKDL
jgi:hypothetical protein